VASGAVVAAGVAAGAVVAAAGVVPVSAGSPAAGVVAGVVVVPAGPPPPSQAPSMVARLNMRAKPKIFVFITPLSPIIKAIPKIAPVEYDSLFVDFC
jgi:hypothetical protein